MSKPCMNKLVHRCWAAVICILATSISANAECVSIPGGLPAHVRLSAFVFDGTVLRVDQVASDGTLTRVDDADLSSRTNPEGWQYHPIYVATMDVHRVWKGDVSRQFKVYFIWNWDGPSFKVGRRQIVFARAETEEIRKSLGSTLAHPSEMPGCSRVQVLQATTRRSSSSSVRDVSHPFRRIYFKLTHYPALARK